MSDPQAVIDATRRWIDAVVIRLNLCPFARRVFEGDKIRYVVSAAGDEQALLKDLAVELQALVACPIARVETTLLIHPHALGDFLDYNDFLAAADRLLAELGLRGTVQLATFHPDYRFADTAADAAENYTNRSPHPMLHLLREASIAAVVDAGAELAEIPERNIETLRALGASRLRDQLAELSKART